MIRIHLIAAALVLGGCASDLQEINREPAMTQVGSGLQEVALPVPLTVFPAAAPTRPDSLWSPSAPSLYSDSRARNVGDVLTVKISMNDRAKLDNRSDRSRESNIGLDLKVGVDAIGVAVGADGTADSQSASAGRGSIARSESLDLSVAAVVTSVLPNGNMLISGTQEVRVNHEMRVLSIAGIVRPSDIAKNNTISYDKIAEARLAYGGRGRLTEVQQPPYGQQIYDNATPF